MIKCRLILLVCVLAGAIFLEVISWKIVRTGAQLGAILWETQIYENAGIRTDAMTIRYVMVVKPLREEIYYSNDAVIRTYAYLPYPFKVGTLILAGYLIPVIPYSLYTAYRSAGKKGKKK